MSRSTLRPGLEAGHFRLLAPLGRGSYAEVWKARHRSGVDVALKVAFRRAARALEQEAVRIARLDHPGIVHVYDHGTLHDRPWVALELARGTLADLQSALPLRDLAGHLLRALAHLHARGILHRDIKPTNILVGCAPRVGWDAADRLGVRLADFGIAWAGDDHGPMASGTPGWASPEQARGEVAGRMPQADLYGLAKVIAHLLEGREEGAFGPWLARALHPDPAERFATAAHALAVLPAAQTESTPRPGRSLDDTTRALLAPMAPVTAPDRPPPVVPVAPPWPAVPPLAPLRVPRVALLDTGLSLLPHRPAPLAGRLPVLLELWREAGRGEPLAIRGDPDDVREVVQTLERWAREAGRTVEVVVSASGREIAPLATPALAARVGGLGFEPVTAMRVASTCATWPAVQARLHDLVEADRIHATDDGLAVTDLAVPASTEDLVARIDEASWLSDAPALAAATAELEQDDTWPPQRKAWQLLLCRARLENPDDADFARRLREASQAARAAGETHLADGLAVSCVGILNRARQAEEALALLSALPPPRDPRLAARLALARGFLGFQTRHPDTDAWLDVAAEAHDGRFRAYALATRVDRLLQAGEVDDALEMARRAVGAADRAMPEEALGAWLALANVLVRRKAPEDEIAIVLESARPFAQATPNLAAQGRFQLFCAQHAMREQRWGDADLLLSAAQELSSRRGTPATFIVLNHGLVALHRGDLASIPAITPPDWAERNAACPAYLRGLLELHQLLAALGEADTVAIEAALATLEARSEPLPVETIEPLGLLEPLVSPPLRQRIAVLVPTRAATPGA
ncbi:MAG: serine/threonine-protein kinase [Myxococcota bacterium]